MRSSLVGYNGMQINTVKDMREQILKIAQDLEQGTITDIEAQNLLLGLFGVSGSWVYVNEETPPNDVELLAKAPDGTIHLTSWRPAYDIFCCQCKSESAFEWQWKLVWPITANINTYVTFDYVVELINTKKK